MQFKDDRRNQLLIKNLKEGDRAAFDAIFYAFEPRLYAYTKKLSHSSEDARDVVQEVFLKVWEIKELIDPSYNFDSFLFTIAKNLVYNKAKHRIYEYAYKENLGLFDNQKDHITENMVSFNELEAFIQTASRKMPPVRKEVFRLSRLEGLSHSEIAAKLNTSNSNVKNHIYKALIFLKEQMKMNEFIPVILLFLFYIKWPELL